MRRDEARLRFDPLLYADDWQAAYGELFDEIEALGVDEQIHSVSTGPLRFPKQMHKRIADLYPESGLFAAPLELVDNVVAYPDSIEKEMKAFAHERLFAQLGEHRVFHCQSGGRFYAMKTYIVTGKPTGIGAAINTQLLSRGAHVIDSGDEPWHPQERTSLRLLKSTFEARRRRKTPYGVYVS